MAKINEINLGAMNNSAHFLFITDVLARLKADETLSAKLAKFQSALEEAQKAEDDALKLSQKSLLTDAIVEADALRDQLYSGYKKSVGGYLNFPVAAMADAAKTLSQHIKDYRIDPQEQLDKETGDLVNFIDDLEKKYADEVSALSLTAYVSQLKAANESVRTLTAQRTDERMARTVGAVKTARAASDTAYRDLVTVVNGLALFEGETAYADLIAYVNAEIKHYKQEVISSSAKKSAETTATDSAASKPNVLPSVSQPAE